MFSNANKRQISYYIYWRNCLREGKYLTTDQNYIGLYLNECISSLRFRDPNDVISDMINVWKGYREECQFLDKYVFEHITDIILKYNIEASDEICDYAKDVLDDISLPELFFKRDMNNVSLEYIMKRIGYTYKDSKFYKENKDIYEKHIRSCAIEAIRKFMCNDDYMLMYKLSHDLKEAFSGACVSTENKCWISVSYISIVRNGDLKNDIIQIIKYCENVFRDYVGIKTKYVIKGKMPIEIILFIDNYFKENMGEKRASIISSEKEPEYMKYYEPENKGKADESRASDIENEAWQIAEMLEPEEYTEEEPETETQAVPGNETDDVYRLLYNSLDDDLKDGLKAVYEGTIESFATDKGLMEEEIVRRINELAFDITGDIIIENGEIIEDYREDIERLLEENHG